MAPKVLIVDDNAELVGLLSRVFEDAGYVVVQAQRARQGLEKAKTEQPDVAIVDVLLPDVMGYEVAALLKQLSVPFIMVSGVFKGGRHSQDAQVRHGASAYFEKPFAIERLVEKVGSLVPAGGEQRKRPSPEPSMRPAEDPTVEVDVDLEEPSWELTGRVQVTDSGRERISAVLFGDAIRVPSVPTSPARPPMARSVPVPAPPAASLPVGAANAPAAPARGARTGELRDNLPQLVSAFWLAQETGELVLQRGAVRKVVYFEKGSPVFASSNLATDRFGQFLSRIGKVSAEDLKLASDVATRTKRRVDDVLVELGILSDAQRMYFVGQQVKAIIYSVFAWEDGTYQVTFLNRAHEERLKLDVHPANLIMRGVKKLYSPVRLARLLPDGVRPIPAQDPSYLLSDVELENWEGLLLSRIDGNRTAGELVRVAGKPADAVRGLLVGLCALRILGVSA